MLTIDYVTVLISQRYWLNQEERQHVQQCNVSHAMWRFNQTTYSIYTSEETLTVSYIATHFVSSCSCWGDPL